LTPEAGSQEKVEGKIEEKIEEKIAVSLWLGRDQRIAMASSREVA
jgi:hypothetical protein